MLQRMHENIGPLSLSSLAQPVAFSQLLFFEEEDQQCGINCEDALLPGNSNQVGQKRRYQHGEPREDSAFKFSVSRLPRWAQDKVTSSDIVPLNPNFTLSQVFVYTIFCCQFSDFSEPPNFCFFYSFLCTWSSSKLCIYFALIFFLLCHASLHNIASRPETFLSSWW